MEIQVYTDGSCLGNPGPGGWAAVLIHPQKTKKISGGFNLTTNNRMELTAAVEALKALRFPCRVELFTDSQYLQKGVTAWMPGWKKKGWVNSQKKPVKNKDLWLALDELLQKHEVRFKWVRGHSGHEYNEECDRLAVEAANQSGLPPDPGFPG